MTTYYLRADTEEALLAALEGIECAVDVIGQIPDVAGFHANLRGELSEGQQEKLPLIPEPANPFRIWL